MNIHLKSELGAHRDLTKLELTTLNETLKDSKKTLE